LAAGLSEIIVLSVITVITVFYVIFGMRKILLLNLNEDLAQISGIKTKLWNLSFLILLAVAIALTTRVVGIFLTTALLVLPAAIARIFAKSATQMMVISALIGVVVASLSFALSGSYNLTVGPVIIAIFCVGFFAARALRFLRG
jgi:zinc transport system permease protein